MTFDPFRDFETRGYLRNFEGSKDMAGIKNAEHASFQGNIEQAILELSEHRFVEYKHVLAIHKTLFSSVYPWAGQDRLASAPEIAISKAGYHNLFARPFDVRRATNYALSQSRDLTYTRSHPGKLMGLLAHAHPFLDGNGRTIMTLHTELLHRAGILIDWERTNKTDYLTALTLELNHADKNELDNYLKPFIGEKVERSQSISLLQSLKGLGNSTVYSLKKNKKEFTGKSEGNRQQSKQSKQSRSLNQNQNSH